MGRPRPQPDRQRPRPDDGAETPAGPGPSRPGPGAPPRPGPRPAARRSSSSRERGSATLEAAIIVPCLIGLGVLLVFAAQTAMAHHAVEQAAWQAAREASIARDADTARADAVNRGEALLARLGCADSDVAADTSGFAAPAGQPAEVAVSVACVMDLGGLAFPGIPGSFTFHANGASPIDSHRSRP